VLDRDINAAKNILAEGMRIIGAELSDHTGRDLNKTFRVEKHGSMKQEALRSLAEG
jgi:transposase